MTLVGLLKHLFDVPFTNVTRVGLVEADLQLGTELLLDQTVELIPSHEHIHALRAVVLDLDGTAVAILNGLPLFFREFGSHVPIIAWTESAAIEFRSKSEGAEGMRRLRAA